MTKEQPTKKTEKFESKPEGSRRNLRVSGHGVANVTSRRDNPIPKAENLMEAVVEDKNVGKALHRVEANKGTAGIDNMSVEQLRPYLHKYWPILKVKLLEGRYKPQGVKIVDIPKPSGGKRTLGIPTAVDRFIQQASLQVLSPIFDPGFSKFSYGFRPNVSAHQAIKQAQKYVASGRRWVVDMDLEKFFDRVNHDILMSRVARKVGDKQLLRLIRHYLQAGSMNDGITQVRLTGTPQGSPLSPLLSNIILDDLDKELQRRGRAFCRYADDCNIYVKSQKAGERTMESVSRFLEKKLKLRVNQSKNAVSRPWKRKFLGYTVTVEKKTRLNIAKESVKRFKKAVKEIFRRGRGRNIGRFINDELNPLLRGWGNYFRLNQVKAIIEMIDGWIRRRLRCMLWRQWKRFHTRKRKLRARGLSEEQAGLSAGNGRGAWWNSGASHMNKAFPKRYFDTIGLVALREIMICL
ncbi:MAG: group II intron reverse transcriptase/maturase [Candidatus Omnitrophota bacterium]